ncbi:hypothetical protein Y032_0393g618 [Ancylostoma ceylanicum]|uniref:Uncharacterized protein n=1 Tax=Ancylostoma ceylanicum TaxID=53326 RepID=A0A016RSN4_9BILA|nr:hypothetical protein Y032_0393g618 [Ancylostoma ceylanicum]
MAGLRNPRNSVLHRFSPWPANASVLHGISVGFCGLRNCIGSAWDFHRLELGLTKEHVATCENPRRSHAKLESIHR